MGFPGSGLVAYGYGVTWIPLLTPLVMPWWTFLKCGSVPVPTPRSFLARDGAMDGGAPSGGAR